MLLGVCVFCWGERRGIGLGKFRIEEYLLCPMICNIVSDQCFDLGVFRHLERNGFGVIAYLRL